jgi:hypothetical protein
VQRKPRGGGAGLTQLHRTFGMRGCTHGVMFSHKQLLDDVSIRVCPAKSQVFRASRATLSAGQPPSPSRVGRVQAQEDDEASAQVEEMSRAAWGVRDDGPLLLDESEAAGRDTRTGAVREA